MTSKRFKKLPIDTKKSPSEIVEKLKGKIQTLSSGKGYAPVGAISVDLSLDKIKDQINDAKNNSEVFEGNADEGWFIPPCLVVNPPFGAKILQEETFGPVMTIHPFQTDNDAVELAKPVMKIKTMKLENEANLKYELYLAKRLRKT